MPVWQQSQALQFKLNAETVTVWRGDIKALQTSCENWECLVSPSEFERAQRFKFAADKTRYLTSHAALRRLLQAYTDIPALDLVFQQTAHQKPYLATGPAFNLSHTNTHVLIAITAATPVGVDVEVCDPTFDGLALATHYFTPSEIAQLKLYASPTAACEMFYSLWTCKEALMKADGRGLSIPLSSFSVEIALDSAQAVSNQLPYKLRRFRVSETHLGAVATAVTINNWQFFDIPPALFTERVD